MWGTLVGTTWCRLVQWRSWPTTSSPPATVHVGRGGHQRGTAPSPPLHRVTAVGDTLIVVGHGWFQCAEGGVSVVARPADQHPARRGCTGSRSARAATRPRSGVAQPTASLGPKAMPGRLDFSMTCGVACGQRASPILPRPQLTTLAHQNPSSLAPSRATFPASTSCPHSCRPSICRR